MEKNHSTANRRAIVVAKRYMGEFAWPTVLLTMLVVGAFIANLALFIAGVVPLVLASGAGAEMRHAMGVAVFAGMLGVTLFGLVLTPVFYVVVRKLVLRKEKRKGQQAAIETHA